MSETIDETPVETPAVEEPVDQPTEAAEPDTATADAEPETWSGPSKEEWEQTQAQLAQAAEFVQLLSQAQYAQPEQGEPEAPPEFDMFDPEGVRAHDQWLLSQIAQQQQQMLAPILEKEQNTQAEQWVEQTMGTLGVPERLQDPVLFMSAGFQQFDQYGRPTVHPQQAAQQGYQMLREVIDQERAEAVEEYKQKLATDTQTLQNRAGAPNTPSGPAGGEGEPEFQTLEQATRAWMEKQAASEYAE